MRGVIEKLKNYNTNGYSITMNTGENLNRFVPYVKTLLQLYPDLVISSRNNCSNFGISNKYYQPIFSAVRNSSKCFLLRFVYLKGKKYPSRIDHIKMSSEYQLEKLIISASEMKIYFSVEIFIQKVSFLMTCSYVLCEKVVSY